ncbi:putative cathepsin H [Helianthus anomalus]
MNQILNPSQEFTPLSIQQLVDCYDEYRDDSTSWGAAIRAFESIRRNSGRVYSERDYPCRGDRISRGPCAIEDVKPTVVIDSFNKVGHNERAIAEVVRRQPVTAVVGSLPLRERLYTPGRIIRYSDADGDTSLDHTVLIVGFGKKDGLDYWRCLNFLGAAFGGDGTFYLERNT